MTGRCMVCDKPWHILGTPCHACNNLPEVKQFFDDLSKRINSRKEAAKLKPVLKKFPCLECSGTLLQEIEPSEMPDGNILGFAVFSCICGVLYDAKLTNDGKTFYPDYEDN